MREIDKRIATLRLRLAEIDSRQEQLKALQRQFKNQLDSIVDFTVYENGDLDVALSMVDEVDARLSQTERKLHFLGNVKARGQEELEALQLTRSIDAAKAEMAELEARRKRLEDELASLQVTAHSMSGGPSAKEEQRTELEAQRVQVEEEMKRLHRVIGEASEAAARAVSSKTKRTNLERGEPQG